LPVQPGEAFEEWDEPQTRLVHPHCSVVQLVVGGSLQNSETGPVASNGFRALDQSDSITQDRDFRLGVCHLNLPPFLESTAPLAEEVRYI
jgi:hypothetical protein